MDNKTVSFLLGSGFSIPEGLPSLTEINSKLSQIKEADFYLFSDQTAGFYHSDWTDPNGWMPSSFLDRLFVQEFTVFYCKEYLQGNYGEFNYEKFYDFISDFISFKIEKNKIDLFCESFNQEYAKTKIYSNDSHNWLWRLKGVLNQLIADLLNIPKYYGYGSYSNYPPYGAFFGLLRELLKENVVNVHTLNHDLFFDFMCERLSDLWQHYTDGYTECG